ncbi:MAG: adenylyl-sulfate reductase [Chromatiales bacterium]|nr:adenylyl-sulfate reductase [Chromatiales bacterium]
MFAYNPFAELSAIISPEIMQGYIVLMVILVIGGTILDMMHKQSAKYFFENAKKAQKSAKRQLSGGEKAGLALQTLTNEVLTSSEFKSTRRRISHLFTMYGFVLFVLATAVLIFAYPTSTDAGIWPVIWHVGAIALCIGGYWFWFSIRVDVASEGVKWYHLNGRGDLFILGLLFSATFGLLWSITQQNAVAGWTMAFFVLFVAASTMLFGTVFWSKFAHMFFKPAAAYQKKVIKADGSRENLPADFDLSDPAVHARFPDVPEYMGKNPPNMGLGINREAPRHY